MSIFETAIEWLAPPRCVGCGQEGSSICEDCLRSMTEFGQRCWRCNSLSASSRTCQSCRHTGSPARVYIRTDHDGLARELLSAYKFGHQRAAAATIADQMVSAFRQICPRPLEYLITPVPTATGRVRQRGFDHTALLAKNIAFDLKMPYALPLGISH